MTSELNQTQTRERALPVVLDVAGESGAPIPPQALAAWCRDHADAIKEALGTVGAVLLRGCQAGSPGGFREAVKAVSTDLSSYVDGNSPRRKIASGVYTSTEYPPEYMISLHNELSYSHSWPMYVIFGCVTAAETGGATPIADSREILRQLDPALVEEFRRKQVKYIRNLRGADGIGISWQTTFETTEQAEVEEYARQHGMQLEWKADGGVRISHVRPPTATHPQTGEEVWFNQADQFHPSTLPQPIYESIVSLYGGNVEDFPQYACFGDDTPIDVAMLDEIRAVTERVLVASPWQKADLLLVDNMLVCHGRMPFTGQRKVLVSMFNSLTF